MYDMHTHFIPPEVLTWIRDHKETINAKWEIKSQQQSEFLTINNKWGFEVKEAFVNAELYLKEQSQADVIHSLVSPIPQLFMYEFAPEITSEMVHVYNRSLAAWHHHNSERISALGTVCLQHPIQAAEELRSAIQSGLKGVIIGPGLPEKMLTNDFFIPFWEEANTQQAIVFIHPLLAEDPRLKQRMMPNLIGVPWETTVCATDLLLSGLLDRYPKIKILLAHGGGFLPYQIGRIGKGYEKWKAVSNALQAPPIEYLRRFWFDTVVWNPETLQYLTTIVGEDRVVPGSDYPFDLCAFPPNVLSHLGTQTLLAKPE